MKSFWYFSYSFWIDEILCGIMSVPHNILMDPNSVMSWIVLIDAYGKLFPIVRAIIETTRRSCILKTQVSVKGYKNTNYKVFSCVYIYILPLWSIYIVVTSAYMHNINCTSPKHITRSMATNKCLCLVSYPNFIFIKCYIQICQTI